MKIPWREAVLALTLATVAFVAAGLPPLPQPEAYHAFAETRTVLGIPHFGDVVSNLAFVLVGVLGLVVLFPNRRSAGPRFVHPLEAWPWRVAFAAVVLVGVGSAYYHWEPTHLRLYWDRLAMSVLFMAILAAILGERIHPRAGFFALPFLVLLGMAGATHWLYTELQGAGDLRVYLLTQVLPIVGGLLLILLYRSPYTRGVDFVMAAGWYLLALVAQQFDQTIHAATAGWLSGHTLKHLLAATAVYWMLRMLRRRQIRDESAALNSP
jgi:uncharacterized membrane protein YeaQ/YmgE (transglycosylase-associated protein family)